MFFVHSEGKEHKNHTHCQCTSVVLLLLVQDGNLELYACSRIGFKHTEASFHARASLDENCLHNLYRIIYECVGMALYVLKYGSKAGDESEQLPKFWNGNSPTQMNHYQVPIM